MEVSLEWGAPRICARAYFIFGVYIDDIEEGVTGSILKVADDTKLYRKTKEIGDKQTLQDGIDKLVRWLFRQVRFIVSKVRNSTCPLARDKWIFRQTTKIANIVVRRTTWIAAGSVTRQRSSYFGVRF